MGYNTDFIGSFSLNKRLDDSVHKFLTKFAQTRRMKRKLDPHFGIDGEFFVDGKGMMGQARDESVIDYNSPPRTQPGLWCQWVPSEDGTRIEWDGVEKFYNYIEWISYIIKNFLEPKGYVLNGTVEWHGEDYSDIGQIIIINNKVSIKKGELVFS